MFEFIATRLIHTKKLNHDLIWMVLNYYDKVLPYLPWLSLPHTISNDSRLRRVLQDKYMLIVKELHLIVDKDYKRFVIEKLAEEWFDLIELVINCIPYVDCLKNHRMYTILNGSSLLSHKTIQTCPWCYYNVYHEGGMARYFDRRLTDDEIYRNWLPRGKHPTTGVLY